MNLIEHPSFPDLVEIWRTFLLDRQLKLARPLDEVGEYYELSSAISIPPLLKELLEQRPELRPRASMLAGVAIYLGEAIPLAPAERQA